MKEFIMIYVLIGLIFTFARTFKVSSDKVKMSNIENILQTVNEVTSTKTVSKIVMFIVMLFIAMAWPYMLISRDKKGENE